MNFKKHNNFYKEDASMCFAKKLSEKLGSCFSTFQLFNFSTAVFAVAALLAATANAAANFPLGTHLIKGTLKDWQNKVLTSDAAVTIQAVATNGTVLASTKVADPAADGYNFLLQIPLSTTATDSTAAIGDTLNCVIVQESGLSLAANPLIVGEANAVTNVSLAFVNVKHTRVFQSAPRNTLYIHRTLPTK